MTMNRVMMHTSHKDIANLIEDCYNVPYRRGVNNLLCIDVTDEEFVFIKLKYKVYPDALISYPDMPTYLIPYGYYDE